MRVSLQSLNAVPSKPAPSANPRSDSQLGFKDAFAAASKASAETKDTQSSTSANGKKSQRDKSSDQIAAGSTVHNDNSSAVVPPIVVSTPLPVHGPLIAFGSPAQELPVISGQPSGTPGQQTSLVSQAAQVGQTAGVVTPTPAIGDDAGDNSQPVGDAAAEPDQASSIAGSAAPLQTKGNQPTAFPGSISFANDDKTGDAPKPEKADDIPTAPDSPSAQAPNATQVIAVATPPQLPNVDLSGNAHMSGASLDKGSGLKTPAKDGILKPAGSSSKDRSSLPDSRFKHSANDDDASSSANPSSDALSAAKIAVVTEHVSRQPEAGQTIGNATSAQSAPPAVQVSSDPQAASAAVSSSTNHIAPNSNAATVAAPATPTVSSAQLIQSMHQSEMKVGMHSAEFGNISINTSLTHQSLSAQISIDHSELSKALAGHLTAIEEKLGSAYGLNTRVEVRSNGGSSSGDSAQQQSRPNQSRSNNPSTLSSSVMESVSIAGSVTMSQTAGSSRLDIRI